MMIIMMMIMSIKTVTQQRYTCVNIKVHVHKAIDVCDNKHMEHSPRF